MSSDKVIEQIIRPTGLLDPEIVVQDSKNQIDHLVENIKKVVRKKEKILITTLTKKMAEDLTDHFKNLNIKAEYLHSEIDSLERVKIIRNLRLGEFDVLVGINLLREGLDLPEVSLVAVLDADKQGFLRSRSSLLQVAGRAARNVNGRVILYGDRISDAMKSLIDETSRRRKIQQDYNIKNNITPETILKSADEINNTTIVANNTMDKILDENDDIILPDIDSIEFEDKVKKIERKMLNYAKELKFEEAAILRDHLDKLKEKIKMSNVLVLGSGGREHAIVWSLKNDENVDKVFCAPGNGGTMMHAQNLDVDINDNKDILRIIKNNDIDFTIIGPENPLDNGIVDFLNENGCKVFGPSKYASKLESSKIFARRFMDKYNIPQPCFFECKNEEEVISVATKLGFPIVLKADGLALEKEL